MDVIKLLKKRGIAVKSWQFDIHKNLHREFSLDGFWGISMFGWYLTGFAFGQLGHYGIIVFDYFIGFVKWDL